MISQLRNSRMSSLSFGKVNSLVRVQGHSECFEIFQDSLLHPDCCQVLPAIVHFNYFLPHFRFQFHTWIS